MNFKVDAEKCDHCGCCSSDCPVLIINGESEFPVIKEGKEGLCLKCQHCLAVCPNGAISIWGKMPENSIPVNRKITDPALMENLMKTRRSMRSFKKEEIDKSLIRHLVSVASYAPTAQNGNAVQFTVVDNRTELKKLRVLVYDHIQNAFDQGRLLESRLVLKNFRDLWHNKKIDVIFRDAPHLLITSAPKNGSFPGMDCGIAMTYFDLLANAHGIGTLWDGFAQWVFEEVAPDMKKEIGIPENHEVAAVLLFGRPAVTYARSIQNETPRISEVYL